MNDNLILTDNVRIHQNNLKINLDLCLHVINEKLLINQYINYFLCR